MLTPFIESDDLRGLMKATEAWKGDINDPVKVVREVNSTWTFWRTPLELAVDVGASATMVTHLIDQGALITPPTLKLAINGAFKEWVLVRSRAEYANAEAIISALSEVGRRGSNPSTMRKTFTTGRNTRPWTSSESWAWSGRRPLA